MRRRDRLILPAWAPWLVLLPIAVILLGDHINTSFAWQDKIADVQAASSPRHEAIGRSRVLASVLPFVLVATLAALNFLREYFLLLGPLARRQLLVPIMLFVLVTGLTLILQTAGPAPPVENLIGAGFFEAAFRNVPGSPSMLQVLRLLAAVFTVFLILGGGAVVVGTISCLAKADRRLPVAVRRHYRELQRSRLDTYLYASAFLLVTGLFFIDACLRWPAPFSVDREVYTAHVNALMFAMGLFYSTILASYYIPVAALIGRFSGSSGASWKPGAPSGRESPGEEFSATKLLKTFLALISPAIAGILSQVIESGGF